MLLRTIFRRGVSPSKCLQSNGAFTKLTLARIQHLRYAKCFSHRYLPISPLHYSHTCKYDNSIDYGQNLSEKGVYNEQSWGEIRTSPSKYKIPTKDGVLKLDEVVEFLREEGAEDIAVIKIPEEMCYVTYFIVATALSPRHLSSIAEMLNKFYKQRRKKGQPFAVVEGKRAADDWQCLDLGDMVVHVMLDGTREKYNLEKLWLLGRQYDDLLHEAPTDDEIIRTLSMEGLNLMSMDEDTVKVLGNFEFSNPWLDESEEYSQENDLFGVDGTSSDEKHGFGEEDELGDDDAFLV